MQAADRGMRVPGALGAVPGEHLVQPLGVVGQIIQRDRTILDERDRLGVALHRHHDVQPGFAHLGDAGLERRVGRPHHRVGIAEIGHRRFQLGELRQQRRVFVAVELDQQQAVGLADQHAVDQRAIDRDGAAEIDHGAIDQLHRFRIERNQMAGRLHRGAEAWGTGRYRPPCAA